MNQQEKLEIARMGIYFEALKENPALQVLLKRLQGRAEEAREELVGVDPFKPKAIEAAQMKVKMFKTLVEEIDAFIVEGHLCEQELREEVEQ